MSASGRKKGLRVPAVGRISSWEARRYHFVRYCGILRASVASLVDLALVTWLLVVGCLYWSSCWTDRVLLCWKIACCACFRSLKLFSWSSDLKLCAVDKADIEQTLVQRWFKATLKVFTSQNRDLAVR